MSRLVEIPFKFHNFLCFLSPGTVKLIVAEKCEDSLLCNLSPTKLLCEMYDFMSLNPSSEATDELIVCINQSNTPQTFANNLFSNFIIELG